MNGDDGPDMEFAYAQLRYHFGYTEEVIAGMTDRLIFDQCVNYPRNEDGDLVPRARTRRDTVEMTETLPTTSGGKGVRRTRIEGESSDPAAAGEPMSREQQREILFATGKQLGMTDARLEEAWAAKYGK